MSTASTGCPSAVRKSVLSVPSRLRDLVLDGQRREGHVFGKPHAQLLRERRDLVVPGAPRAAADHTWPTRKAGSRAAATSTRAVPDPLIRTVACACAPPGEYSTAPTAAKPRRAAASGRARIPDTNAPGDLALRRFSLAGAAPYSPDGAQMIDLRSDTATRPTPAMLAAMATAELGDEQLREDPTVNELSARAAELLGQEAALFLPTATMANQIALKVHTRPGRLLIAQERTHIMIYEAGGPAVHSGLVMRGLPGDSGRITPEQIRDVVAQPRTLAASAASSSLEQTHRSAGGRVWPLEELAASAAAARELGLAVHLDGARIMNAAAASGIPAAEYGRLADSVTHLLLEGARLPARRRARLARRSGCERAWREKFLFGGAMRQAGRRRGRRAVRARPPRRSPRRRPRARPAARRGSRRGGHRRRPGRSRDELRRHPRRRPGWTSAEARARIREQGVLVSVLRPGVLRAATYLGHRGRAHRRARSRRSPARSEPLSAPESLVAELRRELIRFQRESPAPSATAALFRGRRAVVERVGRARRRRERS